MDLICGLFLFIGSIITILVIALIVVIIMMMKEALK